jgi:hypothetical protein
MKESERSPDGTEWNPANVLGSRVAAPGLRAITVKPDWGGMNEHARIFCRSFALQDERTLPIYTGAISQ